MKMMKSIASLRKTRKQLRQKPKSTTFTTALSPFVAFSALSPFVTFARAAHSTVCSDQTNVTACRDLAVSEGCQWDLVAETCFGIGILDQILNCYSVSIGFYFIVVLDQVNFREY